MNDILSQKREEIKGRGKENKEEKPLNIGKWGDGLIVCQDFQRMISFHAILLANPKGHLQAQLQS